MATRLGRNQYGKAEVRVVAVDRSGSQHTLHDLNVSSSLRGDFTAAHTAGDNSHVLATDTQRNTVFAFARAGVGTPEEFGLRLARHFVTSQPAIHRAVTGHHRVTEKFLLVQIEVGAVMGTQAIELDKTAAVEKDVETLAREELSLFMLPAGALLPAAGFSALVELAQLFQVVTGGHGIRNP